MRLYYVEVHEARRYSAMLEAASRDEAQRIALERAEAGGLPCDVLDREVIVVRNESETNQVG